MSPLSNTKFWKRGESDTERSLRERIQKLESEAIRLDSDLTETERRLLAEIEELRKLFASGSIVHKPEEGEVVQAGRPIFSQRRARAMARGSAQQEMAERIAKAIPAPKKEDQNGGD